MAVETPDAGFLREGVRKLFAPAELAAILEDVRTRLLPSLDGTIQNWRENYDKHRHDPENHFDELVSTLKEFRDELTGYPASTVQIETALSEIADVIDELRADQPQEPDYDDFRGQSSDEASDDRSRSVFDDVDQ